MPMSAMEYLALKGDVVHKSLKIAAEAFEREFNAPVKEWLRGFNPPEKTICGRKFLVRVTTPQDSSVTDVPRIQNDLKFLLDNNQITLEEVKTLVRDGTIGVANPQTAAQFIASKRGTDPAGYTSIVPASGDPIYALQWPAGRSPNPLSGRFRATLEMDAAIERAARLAPSRTVLELYENLNR